MTQVFVLLQGSLTIGRWILPWVAVLFVSLSLAFAVNGAIAHGSAAVESSTTSLSDLSPDSGRAVTPERCAPIGSGYGSYMDSSIVAEKRQLDCGWLP